MGDNDTAQEECWDLPADFDLYAKHEVKHVYYPSKKACNDSDNNDDNSNNADTNGHTNTTPSSFFLIECIEPDSPLDINNTTQSDSTQYDATGHCVWAGAFLLIQCIHELLEKKYFIKQLFNNNNNNNNNNNIGKNNNKRMIEFGCGTGIGGLAFLMLHKRDDDYDDDNDDDTDDANSTLNSNNSNSENNVVPSSVYFTDNDPDALKVCERNCKLNNLPESSYTIGELTWGEKDAEYATATTDQFDIALATDVLYDIDLIHPLFTSVSECLVRPSSASSSSSSSSASSASTSSNENITTTIIIVVKYNNGAS